jgi:GT2 family glycosyltransferase
MEGVRRVIYYHFEAGLESPTFTKFLNKCGKIIFEKIFKGYKWSKNHINHNISDANSKNNIIHDPSNFVGILVKEKIVSKIRYPKKRIFIDYDDLKYCIRLRSIEKILLVSKRIIFHRDAAKKMMK